MEIQWTLLFFTVISGTGAWLFFFIGLDELRSIERKAVKPEVITVIILLALGGLMSVMHLSHPDRLLEALNHPTSGIFIEAVLIGISALCALIYLIAVMRNLSKIFRKVLAVIGCVLAVVFTFACGSSYMMESRSAWDTITLPLAYLGTAAAAGAALNLVFSVFTKSEARDIKFAGMSMVSAGAVGAVTAAAYCIAAGPAISLATTEVLPWVIALFCSLVIAIICGGLVIKTTKNLQVYAIVALVGSLLGATALRSLMWLLGTAVLNLFAIVL